MPEVVGLSEQKLTFYLKRVVTSCVSALREITECLFVNSGTVMATGDKQQPISAKKSALREIPNENRNTIHKSPGNSPFPMDKTPVKDTVKPSCLASPNGPLVYVRRKLETDSGKINNNNFDTRKHERESAKINGGSSDSPPLKKSRNDYSINELPVPTLNCSSAPVAVPFQPDSKSSAVSFPFRPEPQKPRQSNIGKSG
ncbi:uncharacterized protein LOC109825342 [Asparagus officinalis]|uniref:uncharacterized protein LOC109825342 n=1 Tax=Asparagus officinalis TaxID=4686 RepID=UPI00098E0F74|nr:uncharacterized protein LOC109825342 [Asparagus officinalis]